MIETNNPEIKFALHAVRQSAQLVQQIHSETVTHHLTKDDRSPVTLADFASQALVAQLLSEAFPFDPLVAEEDASAFRSPSEAGKEKAESLLEQVTDYVARFAPTANPNNVCNWIDYGRSMPSGRFWTLDPIDGTKGFLRGDQYAVALALVIDGQVQVGVLGCPNLADGYRPDLEGAGTLVIAARGQGTWFTPLADPGSYEQLNVSQRSSPAEARLLRSFESGHTDASKIEELADVLGIQTQPVRMDSQAKYSVLAAGKGDLMLRLLSPDKPNYREKIWDQAAGSLVIEEAGGQVSDLDGKPLDFTAGRTLAHNRGILASNGLLHPAALEALTTIHA
jgi:3'(2'), 5'-bisphosphate nucleotidase